MCGIVGLASQFPAPNQELLLAMRNTLHHRGPDDAGVWWSPDGRVGLAHQRLAIIDLSPGGHQPMSDASGQLWLDFNGEIYNHQSLRPELELRGHAFRTASDSEVILEAYRAWGLDCVTHLNGMFAFSLYDSAKRLLFLARDRAGEKPLFYCHRDGRFVFASELKAFMADPAFPRQLNLQALHFYLTYGYVPGSMCMLKDVQKLSQGHAMTLDLKTDKLRIWRYWQLPEPCLSTSEDAEALAEELENLLLDSVRLRLAADVPVGILLSGGIDSSLVTALAARVSSRPVKTYTVSFPGYGAYDEGPYARLVAEHFATEHTELVAEANIVALLPELARQVDEPMADSSILPTYLISRMIRQHATVALGGDGGDELFGGYWHHSWIQREQHLRRFVPTFLQSWVRTAAARLLPLGVRGRNYLLGFAEKPPQSLAYINLFFDAQSRLQLLSPGLGYQQLLGASPEAYKAELCSNGKTALQYATVVDFMSYMVDDILVKVDRASMLTSLEIRAPWLDHRIIEFAFGRVPDELRATQKERKILPRRLAQRLLPARLNLTRKQGFSLPLKSWFNGEWGDYIKSILREADPQLFDQQMIQNLIADQYRGFSHTHRLFALTMFELWRRDYRVSFS